MAETSLRRLRKERGLTVNQLSEMTGIIKGSLEGAQGGHIKISPERAAVIAKALGVDVSELADITGSGRGGRKPAAPGPEPKPEPESSPASGSEPKPEPDASACEREHICMAQNVIEALSLRLVRVEMDLSRMRDRVVWLEKQLKETKR